MLNKLRQCYCSYDIMLLCYEFLSKKQCDYEYLEDIEFESPHYNEIYNVFALYQECIFSDKLNAFETLKENLLLLDFQNNNYNEIDCYQIIKQVDNCEEYTYNQTNMIDASFVPNKGLNKLDLEKYAIFPVIKDNYRERINSLYKKEFNNDYLRKRKDFDNTSINTKLNNYVIINKREDLKNYDVRLYNFLGFKNFNSRIYENGLNIAIFPITSDYILDILHISFTTKHFIVENIIKEYENEITKKCIMFVDKLDKDIDLLVFPEMLMSENIINEIDNRIKSRNDINILFTVYGSISQQGDNICIVKHNCKTIFSYYKKIPFDMNINKNSFCDIINKACTEDQKELLQNIYNSFDFDSSKYSFKESLNKINPVNNMIYGIDINGFGRMFFFICKDIDDDKYMSIPIRLLGDFIVVPTCSPSNDVASGAKSMSERYHCTTIITNTCAAICKNKNDVSKQINNNKEIGFIVTPEKNDTDRSCHLYSYNFNDKCATCKDYCPGRFFTIYFNDYLKAEEKIRLKIVQA